MNKKIAQKDLLVILGIDSDGKPHAAVFAQADEAVVHKAAQAMGVRCGVAKDDKSRALARKLPEGKIFAAGKALVPLVKQAVYDQLLQLLVFVDAPGATIPPDNGGQTASASPLTRWEDIKVGSVVLCQDDGAEPAWWESVVIAVGKDEELLTLRWRDYPKLKTFAYKRHEVSLLGPALPVKPTRSS